MSSRVRALGGGLALTALLALTACGGDSQAATDNGGGDGDAATKVGFIMVGAPDDAGYNQAVADGATAVSDALGDDVEVVTADNVPETDEVTQTMQAMVNQGVEVIFATSYGYYQYAHDFAAANPDVTVLHQGGFNTGDFTPNFGTYWGQPYDPVFLGGMAAGAVTETDTLGFVYAFPIPQTIANINGFHLGAASVNPDVRTLVVNTSNWCDPLKQQQAVTSLVSEGADVVSQHQDCQSTVIQAAKQEGIKVVGYHYDAQDLYPEGWLTGSAWNWGDLFVDVIQTVEAGDFEGSQYNANFIGSFADGNSPLELAPFGESVPEDVREEILAEEARISEPGTSIFNGPLNCQDGTELVPAGEIATAEDVATWNCLVEGVVGTLPG